MRILIITLLMCCSLLTKAQNDTLVVSMSQAMAYATKFGYQSINASKDIEIAKKQVNEYLAIGLPQLNGSAGLNNNILLQETPVTIDGVTQKFKMGTEINSSVGARLDQLLFDGSYFIGLKASRVYVKLSENSKAKTEIDIKQAVAEAYFIALIAQQNIADFKLSLDVNEKTLEQTKAYYENGFREDIDVDQIRLMVNDSKRLYLESVRQYTVAMVVLKFAMGYDIDKPIKTTDTIDDLLAPIPLNPDGSLDIQSHIDYRMLMTQIDIQGLDIKNQRSMAMPRLSAFASYDYFLFGPQMSNLDNSESAIIGLSLGVPIFSSGQRSAQLKQKKLELNKLETDKQMLEQSLKSEYFVAKTNLRNAKEQFDNAKEARDIALRIYQKSLIKFENGLMTSLDLSQYENSLVNSHISFRSASVDYYNQYITYQKATSQL